MAHKCGILHPDIMFDMLTPQQARDAEQYFLREPYGDNETHRLLSVLITVVVNALSKNKVEPKDFMPGRIKARKMTNTQMANSIRQWAMSTGTEAVH